MNVTAEEIRRLVFFDELAHCAATGVQPVANTVECGIEWWRVANQYQRLQVRELCEARGQFLFAILARRIERRRVRAAEARDVNSRDFQLSAVEIDEPVPHAKRFYIFFRLVISRHHIHT